MLPFPTVAPDAVPWLTVEQMREVDRLMVEEAGISMARMMENAGRSAAVTARALLGGSAAGRRVLIMAGRGGNGGGGLAAARHLAVAGAEVEVSLAVGRDELQGVVGEQLRIARWMGIPVADDGPVDATGVELVLDALLGYSAFGPPRGRLGALAASAHGVPTLALDIPTGLDPESGEPHEPGIHAAATMTIALPKRCLRAPSAAGRVGQLLLADISVPRAVYRVLGIEHGSPFAAGPLVRIAKR